MRLAWFAPLVLVPFLVVAGGALPAAAQQRSYAPAFMQTQTGTVDTAFVISLLREARLQVALARLAEQREAAPVMPLAAQAGDLWFDAQRQLESMAADLHVASRALDAGVQVQALNRLSRAGGTAFSAAYVQAVARANAVALSRLESLDAGVNSRVMFFADRFLPRFIALQNTVHAQLGR